MAAPGPGSAGVGPGGRRGGRGPRIILGKPIGTEDKLPVVTGQNRSLRVEGTGIRRSDDLPCWRGRVRVAKLRPVP
jgi:hypothetical protein